LKTKLNIPLSDAEEGMELATDVIDAKGVCLISAGTALSASSISGLQKRNIETIGVYKFEQLTDEQRDEKRKAIEQQLDHCFSKVIDQPAMQQLKQILLEHKSRDL